MTPPPEYFRIVPSTYWHHAKNPPCEGAQLVGFDWYVWADQDALARSMKDGLLSTKESWWRAEVNSRDVTISDLEDEVDGLEGELTSKNTEIERLQEKLRLAERQIDELKAKIP
jgi:hypothetical protein